MGLPIECFAPRSGKSEEEREGVHEPGNALDFNSRVVGEKTVVTSSVRGVQFGGGRRLAAAQAETATRQLGERVQYK